MLVKRIYNSNYKSTPKGRTFNEENYYPLLTPTKEDMNNRNMLLISLTTL